MPLRRAVSWRGRGSGGLAPPGGASRGTVPPPLSRACCLGRHLRRRLCWGWGCGGGRFGWRYRQWVRALRKARGSQLLASASVMRSTAPPSRKAGHVGSLSGHAARITDQRTLSWSSGVAHIPGGTSRFPPSLRRSTASKGRFLIPLQVPELAQLNHLYTSTTRGRTSSPRGSGTVPQSRFQGWAPPAPRAGSPCGPCACGAGAAARPPPAEAIRAGSALGAGGAGSCRGRGGWGVMSSPASGSTL